MNLIVDKTYFFRGTCDPITLKAVLDKHVVAQVKGQSPIVISIDNFNYDYKETPGIDALRAKILSIEKHIQQTNKAIEKLETENADKIEALEKFKEVLASLDDKSPESVD